VVTVSGAAPFGWHPIAQGEWLANIRRAHRGAKEAPIKSGMFDYVEFTRILKHGANEKDEQ